MIKIAAAPIVDLTTLRAALQSAIGLELFTIPPYLTALYTLSGTSASVKAARSVIRRVVLEEMLHLNLACNILNAIGGEPKINTPDAVPAYPRPLPMALAGGIKVHLERYSQKLVQEVFMEIEKPETPLHLPEKPKLFSFAATGPSTIGEFYTAIRTEIIRQNTADHIFTLGDPAKQVTDFFTRDVIKVIDVTSAVLAIDTIVQQGEGTPQSPADLQHEPAHYYYFQQLAKGMKLVNDAQLGWVFDPNQPITIDEQADVIPMVSDPQDVTLDAADKEAVELADQCDKDYSSILNGLHKGFNGDQAQLAGIDTDMDLFSGTIRDLLAVELKHGPHAGQHAGPRFKYVP